MGMEWKLNDPELERRKRKIVQPTTISDQAQHWTSTKQAHAR